MMMMSHVSASLARRAATRLISSAMSHEFAIECCYSRASDYALRCRGPVESVGRLNVVGSAHRLLCDPDATSPAYAAALRRACEVRLPQSVRRAVPCCCGVTKHESNSK
jgi:hypothetical protein